jgi:hypothetical protein
MHKTVRVRERVYETRVGCKMIRYSDRSISFDERSMRYSHAKPCSSTHASLTAATLFNHASEVMTGLSMAFPFPLPAGGALEDR